MILSGIFGAAMLASCGGEESAIHTMHIDRTAMVGTVPFSAPFIYQKEGNLVGPEAMLAERIVARIDENRETQGGNPVRIIWMNRTHATLFNAIKNGEVQIGLGAFGKTEQRTQEILFSNSYYTMDLVMAVNPVNKDITPAELASAVIGVREGSAVQSFVESKYPSATIKPYGTVDDVILALRTGETDAVIDGKEMVAYALTTLPGAGHMDYYPDPLGSIDIAVAVRNGDTRLIEVINSVIAESKEEIETMLGEHLGERVAEVQQRREERLYQLAQAAKPREVTIRVSREQGYRGVDIYRMANLRFIARNSETGQTTSSSPIQFSGSTGITRVTVVPGTYSLSLPQFNFNTQLIIVPEDPDNVSVRITIGPGGVTMVKD